LKLFIDGIHIARMRFEPADPQLFVQNRAHLSALLEKKSIAVFHSNDVMPTNADGTMPFKQNSDLYYLSGIDQEESILLLFPEAKDERDREILFVRETNEHIAIWEGAKLTKKQAQHLSGVTSVMWTKDFDAVFHRLVQQVDHIYLNANEHLRAESAVETRDARFGKKCRRDYPLHTYKRVAPLMHQLRVIKHPEEIKMLQVACDIT